MALNVELGALSYGGGTLHGIIARPAKPKGVVMHLHGTWGNFYGNPFIVPLGEVYVRAGYTYLSANIPGHDETAVHEQFLESLPAITAWLDWAGDVGPIILQGHSLGALKALAYASAHVHDPEKRPAGLVLLSPYDVVAFYCGMKPERLPEIRSELERVVSSEGPRALVPKRIFDLWDISAGTMLDLLTPGNAADCFPSRAGLREQSWMKWDIPTLVCIGGSDFAAYPGATEVLAVLRQISSAHPQITPRLIEGAPHNFAGRLDALIGEVQKWVR